MLPRHHRILALAFKGGFLDGARLEFTDGLNCVVGGRGTGKTTVLEALRFVFDRIPDPQQARERARRIDKLIQSNLRGGSVRVEVETADGACYTVERAHGEPPLVTNALGEPVEITIGRDLVFGVEVYGQNEVEEIASDPASQLQLLDGFAPEELRPLEAEVREARGRLRDVAARAREARRATVDLAEEVRELPDLTERLRALEIEGSDERAEVLRREHAHKTQREREQQLFERLERLSGEGRRELEAAAQRLDRRFADASGGELEGSPNLDLIDPARTAAKAALTEALAHLEQAGRALEGALPRLIEARAKVVARHGAQERRYREMLEVHEEDRTRARERVHLERRALELEERRHKLVEQEERLAALTLERRDLHARLSELRDRRSAARTAVAKRLTAALAPLIRVRIEPDGNKDEYRALLKEAFRGSGLKVKGLLEVIADRIHPTELAALVQQDDRDALAKRLELEPERATRVLLQLKDSDAICAIEAVELHDRPVIELKDGPDYKASDALSTGQRCTTILPILLLESERPLLIDQPEDNLDNAFVYDTIVASLRAVGARRQLIFVTHNPNIPVLGEASRVFVLESTGRSAGLRLVGDVDAVRGEIEAILEGGPEAFQLRMRRYGY